MRDVTTPEQIGIRDALMTYRKLSREEAITATLANFRCEYCGLDFLDPSHPENHFQWIGWDHLIPRCKGGPVTDADNLVCSCRVCNQIKLRWDPRTDDKFKDRHTPPSRSELIEAAQDYIKAKKVRYNREVSQYWRDLVGRRT